MLSKTLFRADESKLSLAGVTRTWSFDATPETFKLAAEATRINLAYLFDPMMAVHTSDVEPLPHQISAVYEAMLPRQPLRFVLADDPGAGKTIMAGLFIRELIMRATRALLSSRPEASSSSGRRALARSSACSSASSRTSCESTATGNPFVDHDHLIAKLDQLARNEDCTRSSADAARWDLVIFDEAHKMSAHYGTEDQE